MVKRRKRAGKKKRIGLSKKTGRKKGAKALRKELKSGKQLWARSYEGKSKWFRKSKNGGTRALGYTPPPPPKP